ncbi:SDH family Clp fold serine proteinase [Legionella pneumophila]|uniref:SDH family Clp fold serine proteinase n=1 Tax=Legionella pneumophila TaxID=446 RepID=UPI001A34690F|nr:hypothetical protein [Legionella pneumophila]HAU2139551.1 hypothetical protein [Legionella pneumophila]HCW6795749.1 hypothetical protein [Legionella pneumophila]HEL9675840.1 hypothetical protein [Legionella pneumophila]HEM1509809.1 hypothetical protein [Legionella pneumophila]
MQQQLLELAKLRNSNILIYATGDRPNLCTQIDEDIIQIFHEVLESIGNQENIDLFIYSRGGSTIVPLPLVRLIRKYCTKFGVIVPFRAHSAATMISVGADEIYMTRKAELGPVDPQLQIPQNQGIRTYATTDLFAYLEFAKSEIGWQQSNTEISLEILEYFHKYCALPPDLIGKIYRLYTQSRKYIIELAKNRSEGYELEKDIINQLADILVSGFGSHDYKIDSIEAKNLGLNIINYSKELEDSVNSLFNQMVNDLKLNEPFIPSSPGEEIASIIMSANKIAVKSAIINSVGKNKEGQSIIDMGITPWIFKAI